MEIVLRNGRKIGDGHPCFVVAEVGQNHQGDAYTATRLIAAADSAEVDAVKLCKRDIESDLTQAARDAPYDNPHSFGRTYGEHREALELSIDEYVHLRDRIQYNEWSPILFATVCDLASFRDVEAFLDPEMYKIASRDIDNIPLIEAVAETKKPAILSTGMANLRDVHEAVSVVRQQHSHIIVLYCVSEYPTPDDHIELRTIPGIRETFGALAGFSDHTVGVVAAQAAVAVGACMVEKHLTLSRAMKGTDHAASLEPDGMRRMVRNIRTTEQMMQPIPWGEPTDAKREAIEQTRRKLGRSLVTKYDILPGAMLTHDMLTLKSPGTGIPYGDIRKVLGRRAERLIPRDTTLQFEHLTAEA